MFGLVVLAGLQLTSWFMKREKAPRDEFWPLAFVVFISGLLGARLFHVFFYEPELYLSNPIEILKVWEGGIASHGAAVGIILAIIWFSKYRGSIYYWWIFDRLAMIIALGSGFIRIGNLMNSELYGKATDVPWAFVFSSVDEIARHPVQIYEAFYCFAIFGILMWMYLKTDASKVFGTLSGSFLILLTISRILAEFFKEHHTSMFELNMGQLLSLPFLAMGIIILGVSRMKYLQ